MVTFVQGDIRDSAALDKVFATHKPDAVMHFCASIVVSESCVDPLKYYENNVSGTISLLQCMQRHGTKASTLVKLCSFTLFCSTLSFLQLQLYLAIQQESPLNQKTRQRH